MSHDRATGQDAVAASYDSWSDTYDSDRNLTRDLDADGLRLAGLATAGRDVLEIGCGTGKNTVWLAEQASTVTALDFSPGMIDHARKRVTSAHVTFISHDIRHPWPVADNSIAGAFSASCIPSASAWVGVPNLSSLVPAMRCKYRPTSTLPAPHLACSACCSRSRPNVIVRKIRAA